MNDTGAVVYCRIDRTGTRAVLDCNSRIRSGAAMECIISVELALGQLLTASYK